MKEKNTKGVSCTISLGTVGETEGKHKQCLHKRWGGG